MKNQSIVKSKFASQLTSDFKKPFFSEDDAEKTPQMPQISKPSKFGKGSSQPYQTDESDCSPKQVETPTSPKIQNKLSKFQQKDHEIEKSSDIQFDSEDEDDNTKQNTGEYDLEIMSKRLEEKYNQPKKVFQPPTVGRSSSSKDVINKDDKTPHPYSHLIFGKRIDENRFYRYIQIVQSGLLYAVHSLKGPSENFLKNRIVRLKEATKKKSKILVLDLDETLIHSCTSRDKPDVTITLTNNREFVDLCFNVRPYCREFIQEMSQYYTIYLFTASSELYANSIVEYLDPKRQYITDILCRNNCFETKNGFFIKDLRIISNRQLKDIVIVDNLPHSFGLQIDNGIPILEWINDPKDEELKHIQQYLIELSQQDDVRTYNRQHLKLSTLADYKTN